MRRFLKVAGVGVLLGVVMFQVVGRVMAFRSAWHTAKDIQLRRDLAASRGAPVQLPGRPPVRIPGQAPAQTPGQTASQTPSLEPPGMAVMWPLPTNGTHTLEVQVGSCDSLELVAGGYGAPVELTLLDPNGRTVPPGPRDGSTTGPAEAGDFSTTTRWVRSPIPGAWTVTMKGRAYGMLWGYEHGGAIVLVNQPPNLAPGEPQRVEVFTQHHGEPITGLRVSATLTNPYGKKTEHVMADDGTNGDLTAGDGLYTMTVPGNDVEGIYLVEVWAHGTTDGITVDRETSGTYQVETLPDVAIVPGGVVIRPTADPGVYEAEVRFTNVGNGPAEDVGVRFRDLNTGRGLGDPRVPHVGPGDTVTVSVRWEPGLSRRDSLRVEVGLWSGRDYVSTNDGAATALALAD